MPRWASSFAVPAGGATNNDVFSNHTTATNSTKMASAFFILILLWESGLPDIVARRCCFARIACVRVADCEQCVTRARG